MGAPAGEIKLRMNWTFPIAISPHDHNTVYVGSQYVHATTDGGQTWRAISPDLTLNDKSMMGDSGGLTVDNLSVEYAGVVFSIAESPLEKGLIWAGTNDGLVQVTRDGGRALDERDAEHPGPAAEGDGQQRRALAARRRHLLRRRRPAPGRQPRPVLLQDDRLREDVEGHQREHPEEPAQLRARPARGPVPEGDALRRDGERPLRLVRRRRPLGAAADQAAARARLLADGPGALPRPRRRHVRARLLHPRRRHAARAAHGCRPGRGRAPLHPAPGLPLPQGRAAERRAGRGGGGSEPAVRRFHQLLAQGPGQDAASARKRKRV